MISIVMASYLGAYKHAAVNRPEKLKRAINSVLRQSFQDWELIVISDGCDETSKIVSEYADERINCYQIPKQSQWSGVVRNTGIDLAKGEYIIYLDNDDMFGPSHLKNIAAGIEAHPGMDWYVFNDMIPDKDMTKFIERPSEIRKFQIGTANIAHRKVAKWNEQDDYLHDWNFICKLKAFQFARIPNGQYLVCHIPRKFDL